MTDTVRTNRPAELREMRAHPFRLTLLAIGLVSIAGCHHPHRESGWMSTAGYRYSAGAAIVGPERDTLRVAVVVVNESNQRRALSFFPCLPYASAVKARVSGGGRNWNSEIYEERQNGVYRDSTAQPMVTICSAIIVRNFPPGGSNTYVLTVPVRGVLGDSLPSGRYRVTARLVDGGGDGRKLDAGEVVLAH
jgi:hypothetical protein